MSMTAPDVVQTDQQDLAAAVQHPNLSDAFGSHDNDSLFLLWPDSPTNPHLENFEKMIR